MTEPPPQPATAWRMGIGGRVLLALAASVLIAAAAGGAAAVAGTQPLTVFVAALGSGFAFGFWCTRRILGSAGRAVSALRDGVAGFHDGDFSLYLASNRGDEIGDLLRLYNTVGDALREERGALARKEILLDTMLQATPVATILVNPGGRVVLANRAATEILAGLAPGVPFESVVAECPEQLREALAAGREALVALGGGSDENTVFVARRTLDFGGQRYTIVLIQPLTQELRRQEVAAWKRTIRTMSHELNNSLAPIASLARSSRRMLEEPERGARLNEALEIIEERARHLHAFLEGFARLARLPQPNPAPAAWAPLLSELSELYTFTVDGELPAAPGWFDAGQIQQVLINLLKNAHESGSPSAEVRLSAHPTADGGVRLRVADRGSGMDAGILSSALLPFTSSKPGGAGLGLALCREIVEAHGGRLRIEARLGGGTAVTCWLPGQRNRDS